MPFQKGKSGNPGGRPKKDTAIVALARKHCPKAMNTLALIMDDAKAPYSARVTAACAILDRGHGKPPQSLDVTTHKDPGDMSLGELLARANEIIGELGAGVVVAPNGNGSATSGNGSADSLH